MSAVKARVPATVLVVDDDDAVRTSLQFMLELEGLDVRVFDSGESLLSEPELPSRGCLVIDQRMPKISGTELVRKLKQRSVRLPAILITGRLTADVMSKAKQAGCSAVFEKPLDDGGLVDAIHSAIALSDAAPAP